MERCAEGLPTFTLSTNYINKKGKHPEFMSAIYLNKLVFKKEDLTDNNWLYIGNATEEEKNEQLQNLEFCNGWIWITN